MMMLLLKNIWVDNGVPGALFKLLDLLGTDILGAPEPDHREQCATNPKRKAVLVSRLIRGGTGVFIIGVSSSDLTPRKGTLKRVWWYRSRDPLLLVIESEPKRYHSERRAR